MDDGMELSVLLALVLDETVRLHRIDKDLVGVEYTGLNEHHLNRSLYLLSATMYDVIDGSFIRE